MRRFLVQASSRHYRPPQFIEPGYLVVRLQQEVRSEEMLRDTLGLFVVGTDTDVGKSLVACALVRWLRAASIDTVGFKPVATGEEQGQWSDAVALHEASERCEPIEKICPLRFKLAKAPTIAARHEGIDADINLARWAFSELCLRHQAVIVEGVGGVLCPLDEETSCLDFAGQLGFPLLLVARAALGTISHTLLTLNEISRRQLPLAGIILNVTQICDDDSAEETRREIERISRVRIDAVLPYLSQTRDGPAPTRTALIARTVAALDAQVNIKQLLGLEGRKRRKGSRRL